MDSTRLSIGMLDVDRVCSVLKVDHGEKDAQILRLAKAYRTSTDQVTPHERLKFLLPFAESGKYDILFSQISPRIDFFYELDVRMRSTLQAAGIAKYIFSSNRIEFESLPTVEDTERLIEAVDKGSHVEDHGPDASARLYQLLKSTYRSNPDPVDVAIDVPKLLKWFSQLSGAPGEIRSYGLSTQRPGPDVTTHYYPSHEILRFGLDYLCQLVWAMLSACHDLVDKHLLLRYGFAIAVFAQFHFVELHPFPDFNGRLCRYLSKRILDAFLPLTVPQFSCRDSYIAALVSGATNADPFAASEPLFEVMLRECAAYYEVMLSPADKSVCIYRHEIGSLPQILYDRLKLAVADGSALARELARVPAQELVHTEVRLKEGGDVTVGVMVFEDDISPIASLDEL